MSRNYDQIIMKRAKAVWQVMHDEAYKRGMALQKERHYGDGRIIVSTVGAFIKGLNKERGWGLDSHQIDLVRRYLKATGNVVVLSKIEQYKFRIFIREEWHEGLLVTEPITTENPSRADKISPRDAGEDREPAPVTYKCHCGRVFSHQNALNAHMGAHADQTTNGDAFDGRDVPISEQMAEILLALDHMGGEVTNASGFATRNLCLTAFGTNDVKTVKSASTSLKALDDRGWIDRKQNAKRTYSIALSDAGRKAIKDINHHRQSRYVVEEYLQRVERVTKGRNNTLYETIGTALGGVASHRVGNAVLLLEQEGLVEVVRPTTKASDAGYPTEVIWKGDPAPRQDDPQGAEGQDVPAMVKDQTKAAKEEALRTGMPVEGAQQIPQKAQWLSDEALVKLLAERLAKPKVTPETRAALQRANDMLDLIAETVKKVNEGSLTPLKALGDIEAALDL